MTAATAPTGPKPLSPAGSHAPPGVAPFITAAVGDVSRPRAMLFPSRALKHIPGEGGPFHGIANLVGWSRRGVDHVLEKERRYGKVFRAQFGKLPYVHVGEPELIAQITRNEDRAWSCALGWQQFFDGVDRTSETLDYPVTMDFELHRDARKLLQPAFGAAATASYLARATPAFERAIDSWVARGRVDFKQEIRRVLARISTETFLGIEDEREASVIEAATADVWGNLLALAKNRILSPTHRRARNGHARLVETLRPRVAERRARGGEDLFSRLCAETRGAEWLDDDGVVRLFMGILFAAFDTTASALTSMAYLLAKNVGWQERLRAEARRVSSGRIAYEEIAQLEEADRAWKESLRLMPVSFSIPRYSLRDVQLGAWRIPAGTFVASAVASVQRGEWWTNPHQFDPDRFAPERAEDRKHKGLFLPFGAGAHACIGMHLATVEAKAFWHALLSRCSFTLERDYDGRHTFTPLGVVSGDVSLRVKRLD